LILAANILLDGGVVCIPTDTVYGITSIADDVSAVKRVFQLKNRPEGTPLPIFISSATELDEYTVGFSPEAKMLANEFWPGALTIIANRSDSIPPITVAGFPSAGFRIPNHYVPIKLAKLTRKPITGTSANISGQPEAKNVDDVVRMFGKDNPNLDMVLDGGTLSGTIPSTVVDVTSGDLKIIRVGMVGEDAIRRILCQE
tara:strand:+ start:23346 stop:23945 length:600 start_codon:yes stop_codon:yes gene_type:complete